MFLELPAAEILQRDSDKCHNYIYIQYTQEKQTIKRFTLLGISLFEQTAKYKKLRVRDSFTSEQHALSRVPQAVDHPCL